MMVFCLVVAVRVRWSRGAFCGAFVSLKEGEANTV